MTGCNHIGRDEIERRKIISDNKNDTDNLTFADSKTNSSHGEAAKAVRDRSDSLKIKHLESQTEEDYYNELLKDGF